MIKWPRNGINLQILQPLCNVLVMSRSSEGTSWRRKFVGCGMCQLSISPTKLPKAFRCVKDRMHG